MDNPESLAVYVHWPYCTRICPYCDFNVYKAKSDDNLVQAILRDLDYWRELSGPRIVSSIHFGGGTPSLMRPGDIKSVIAKTQSLWTFAEDIEIALEANPSDLPGFRAMSAAGINRLSIGVQSFDDDALKFLGRDHDGRQAFEAVKQAAALFASVSLDLIFGWRGQTEAKLKEDINAALASGAQHISTYQLTIEEKTAFAKAEERGQTKSVPPDVSADFYEQLCRAFIAAGFDHYEVSNFARPGHQSRHNLAYWRGYDYAGIGPGAHGRLTMNGQRHASITAYRPGDYQFRVKTAGQSLIEFETLSPQETADEYVIMGLRISDGISMAQWQTRLGADLPHSRIDDLINSGHLEHIGDRLRATDKGRRVLNTVTEQLLT